MSTARVRNLLAGLINMFCSACGEEGVFDITCSTLSKVYRKSICQACRKISRRQHAALLKIHKHPAAACECCGDASRKLVIDHCHLGDGTFRGWLCQRCNTCIGGLGDAQESLQKALDYLARSKAK